MIKMEQRRLPDKVITIVCSTVFKRYTLTVLYPFLRVIIVNLLAITNL